jgi:hypothetical protein
MKLGNRGHLPIITYALDRKCDQNEHEKELDDNSFTWNKIKVGIHVQAEVHFQERQRLQEIDDGIKETLHFGLGLQYLVAHSTIHSVPCRTPFFSFVVLNRRITILIFNTPFFKLQ